tara:strand:- start:6461 stop:8614 length:2154 start_codon:yes stop_codon:yes gene_type:complete
MKKILFIIILITLLAPSIKATHIVGGELNYLYLGNNNYEIRLTVYRDCYNGVPLFDDPAALGIFDSNNLLLDTILMSFISLDTLPPTINSPCVIPPTNVCYEVTTYIDTILLPPIPGGYQLAYQRCCRNYTILNIVLPDETGATYYATIPDTIVEVINSNPIFNSWPPPFICSSLPFEFDHSATDPEGDSLYYELFQPFHGANLTNPMPQPPFNPPYPFVIWNPPYSTSDMLGGTVPLSINPTAGLLTATPGPLGQFVVGIKVSEYRDGVFLSETKRDFQFNVVPCVNLTVAALQAPNFSCESYTASFSNNSSGAGTFLWNFGDLTTTMDTSIQFTPSYTYSDTGIYEVTLIAFSDFDISCNDTSIATVTILPAFELNTNYLNAPCTQDVLLESNSSLDSTGNVIFDWDFGNNTGTSTLQNPNYTYLNSGTYDITLIAHSPSNIGCNDTITFPITIFPSFTLNSSLDITPCSPKVDFTVNSSFDGLFPIDYFWDFGDVSILEDTSNLVNPNYTYLNPGSYNISIIAITDSPACGDTANLQVTIYPEFTFTPTIKNIKCTYGVNFIATSSLDDIITTNYNWKFGDGATSNLPVSNHIYNESGSYDIILTITTSNGCNENYTTTIDKELLSEVFVPNAFTPNGDNENDLLFVRGAIDEMSIKIYNRWGELVFESVNQSLGWDGTFNGAPVTPGVFVYHLITRCAESTETLKKGNLTVIR